VDPERRALTGDVTAARDALGAVIDDHALLKRCAEAARLMVEAVTAGHRIWWCGNGGSAAEAQHLAAELSGRFLVDRAPLPSEALHVNSSYLTAVANDYGYDATYSRLLDGIAQPGDVLVCLSTSGNSANVVEAARTARRRAVHTIAMTGPGGGLLAPLADVLLAVPAPVTAVSNIQETHLVIGHALCGIVEATVFDADGQLRSSSVRSDPPPRSSDPERPSRLRRHRVRNRTR
jgi:D-sedoheptulose 7-phosphate isomerase